MAVKPANELAEWVEASAGMGTALGTAADMSKGEGWDRVGGKE